MILVSACLAGEKCRMDGKDKLVPEIKRLVESGEAVAVCPEVLGGLPTPRRPSERRGDRVVNAAGEDVTEQFRRGAEEAMRICREHGCTRAILKSKSPSCGCGVIHNGSFDGGLTEGNGILTQMLLNAGISVITENDYNRENGISFIRLRSADTEEYRAARELYSQCFPIHEQREEASQRAIMADGEYYFTQIMSGDRMIGCILYWETADFIYVEHFFISPALRNLAYGRRTLEWITGKGKPVILEIDPVTDELTKRRKGFYERAGFHANEFSHVHPPYHAGMGGHRLTLMSYPETISDELYPSWFEEHGRNVYLELLSEKRRTDTVRYIKLGAYALIAIVIIVLCAKYLPPVIAYFRQLNETLNQLRQGIERVQTTADNIKTTVNGIGESGAELLQSASNQLGELLEKIPKVFR